MVFHVVLNLKIHHGKLVSLWLKEHSDDIQFFYLPPYCPDLNLNEYFNNLMEQKFHSQIQPRNIDEFQFVMGKILYKLQKLFQKIENFFLNNHIKYSSKNK
jgi:hypothetical protein